MILVLIWSLVLAWFGPPDRVQIIGHPSKDACEQAKTASDANGKACLGPFEDGH